MNLAEHPLPEDNTPPTASVVATDLTRGGGTTHARSVTYTDNIAVDLSTLDGQYVAYTRGGNSVNLS